MQARKLQEKLQQANQYLRVEKSSRESLDHLAKEAKKLGFVPPREEQIVPVDVR
ncbi:MAG: hypothetical protein HZA78_11845 [Candidatus Schekmanbacteria bacterium]|nr:hypothetical protein [Candidatus Schekmanbacteria bacterium]